MEGTTFSRRCEGAYSQGAWGHTVLLSAYFGTPAMQDKQIRTDALPREPIDREPRHTQCCCELVLECLPFKSSRLILMPCFEGKSGQMLRRVDKQFAECAADVNSGEREGAA